MTFTNSILTIGELIVLFFQLGNYFSRRQDRTRLRFLILTAFFVAYNLVNGFLLDNATTILYYHVIIAITGGSIFGTYYFYYLATELEINYKQHFHLGYFLLSLIGSFIACFLFTFWISHDLNVAFLSLIIIPIVTALYFCAVAILYLIKSNNLPKINLTYRTLIITSNIGIICIVALPVSLFLKEIRFLVIIIVNATYLYALYSYMKYYNFQCKVETEFLNKSGYLPNTIREDKFDKYFTDQFSTLTNREKQVAHFILKELTHREIADILVVAVNTVTNHASKIYKKTKCDNRNEFIERFQNMHIDSEGKGF